MSNHKRPVVDNRLAKIEEVVHQIAAVRASLDGVVDVIVEDLVEDCVAAAKKGKSVSDTVLELQQVVASSR